MNTNERRGDLCVCVFNLPLSLFLGFEGCGAQVFGPAHPDDEGQTRGQEGGRQGRYGAWRGRFPVAARAPMRGPAVVPIRGPLRGRRRVPPRPRENVHRVIEGGGIEDGGGEAKNGPGRRRARQGCGRSMTARVAARATRGPICQRICNAARPAPVRAKPSEAGKTGWSRRMPARASFGDAAVAEFGHDGDQGVDGHVEPGDW